MDRIHLWHVHHFINVFCSVDEIIFGRKHKVMSDQYTDEQKGNATSQRVTLLRQSLTMTGTASDGTKPNVPKPIRGMFSSVVVAAVAARFV